MSDTDKCPTCGSTDPNANCGLSWAEIGCDHPQVLTDWKDAFAALFDGSAIREHKANFEAWMVAHGDA